MSQIGNRSIIGEKMEAMNILKKYLEIIFPSFGMLKSTDALSNWLDMKGI